MLPFVTLQLWFNFSSSTPKRVEIINFGCKTVHFNYSKSGFKEVIKQRCYILESSILIKNLAFFSETLQPCLLSTGVVWEFCDRLPTLPKTNKEAVASVLSREEQLINDAIEELEQVCYHFHSILNVIFSILIVLDCGN